MIATQLLKFDAGNDDDPPSTEGESDDGALFPLGEPPVAQPLAATA